VTAYMTVVALLVCGYAVISALETLTVHGQLAAGGLMSWENSRIALEDPGTSRHARALERLYRFPNVRTLYVLQLMLAVGQLLTLARGPNVLVCALLVVTWLISQRTIVGQDGADQMALLVLLALSLWVVIPTPTARFAVCLFIAGEGIASYAIAGYAKLGEAGWRDGSHLAAIFRTESYGVKWIGDLLLKHRALSVALSTTFIVWECTVLFAMFAPVPVAIAYLAVGVFFHVMNALIMGLNTFLFSFVATYPATLYLLSIRPW
jgi:hypothetical protein